MSRTTSKRTVIRTQFLADLLITAVENSGYGWFQVSDYDCDAATATIHHEDLPDGRAEINVDTMAHGLHVINGAVFKVDGRFPDDGSVLHNAWTGQRLYMSPTMRRELLLSSRTNGEQGDYDVIGALAVLECALFGAVTFG